MKFQIKHEIKGRLRIHMKQSRMTFEHTALCDTEDGRRQLS